MQKTLRSGRSLTVNASGMELRLRLTPGEVGSLLAPLALALRERQRGAGRRILFGLAGGAGTGKTVLGALLCDALAALEDREIATVVSMDGYHFPNSHLDAHRGSDQGRDVTLRAIKGRPPTFDVGAFAADLRRLRSPRACTRDILLPAYDRRQHEPVPRALRVRPCHRIVIVEGLHLLRPEPGWNEVRSSLDFCTLLEVPLDICRQRVVARKIAGGRDPAEAAEHFERVDRPTLEESCDPAQQSRAELVIRLSGPAKPAGEHAPCRLAGCELRTTLTERITFRAIPSHSVRLLAVGLNPALQKTLVFDGWERGQVNRARAALTSVGGKGQQFSRAASRVIPGRVLLAQFLGGENGARLRQMIGAAGVEQITVEVAGETRSCTTVIDTSRGEATELVEPSTPIPPDAVTRLAAAIRQTLERGTVSGIALCGTYPPGVDAGFYAGLARRKGGALLLLDSYKGIEATLATGAVDILKVNAEELRSFAATLQARPAKQAAPTTLDPLPSAALAVLNAYRIGWLAVTAGPKSAWLFEQPHKATSSRGPIAWRSYEFRLPAIDRILNPIGAGDTVGAVFLAQLAAGRPAPDAFACGLAAGSASCRQWGGADFELGDLRAILAGIRLVRTTRWWLPGQG